MRTVVHWCGPLKIDDEWIEVNKEFGSMPICMYCGKSVRKGGYADHHFPYNDDYSFHVSCDKKARNK